MKQTLSTSQAIPWFTLQLASTSILPHHALFIQLHHIVSDIPHEYLNLGTLSISLHHPPVCPRHPPVSPDSSIPHPTLKHSKPLSGLRTSTLLPDQASTPSPSHFSLPLLLPLLHPPSPKSTNAPTNIPAPTSTASNMHNTHRIP